MFYLSAPDLQYLDSGDVRADTIPASLCSLDFAVLAWRVSPLWTCVFCTVPFPSSIFYPAVASLSFWSPEG